MNSSSINYYHTNVVIPSVILANKEFFLNTIFRNSENMEIFITQETYQKAVDELKVPAKPITCELSAADLGKYFVVFVSFPKNYQDANIGLAIANHVNDLKYFTFEKDNDGKALIWEFYIDNDKITKRISYGETTNADMNAFINKIKDILEGG